MEFLKNPNMGRKIYQDSMFFDKKSQGSRNLIPRVFSPPWAMGEAKKRVLGTRLPSEVFNAKQM